MFTTNLSIHHKLRQIIQKYNTLHNFTNPQLDETLHKSTTLYTIIQNSTTLHTILHNSTQLHIFSTTLHLSTRLYTTLSKTLQHLWHNLHICFTTSGETLQTFTNTLQNSTILYNTLHKLYTTLQDFYGTLRNFRNKIVQHATKLYNIVQTCTTLYTILRNSTNHTKIGKVLHSCSKIVRTFYKQSYEEFIQL